MSEAQGTGQVVEVIVFKLKDGVDPKAWLASCEPATEWAAEQPGYISSELYHDPNSDTWTDVGFWESEELSRKHLEAAPTEPRNQDMFSHIDLSSAQMIVGHAAHNSAYAARAK